MAPILWPAVFYVAILLLHLVVPARWVDGYVTDTDTGKKLRYRLNGLRVLVVTVIAWALACRAGLLAWDALFVHRWDMLAGAFVVGILFTLAIVLAAKPVPGRSLLADLYYGRLENPQWGGGRIDAKMYLYLAGAVLLELNVLSFTARHLAVHGADPSLGVLAYAALFTFFVTEYLWFEEVHLYTYDFMAERVGFKLGWGCLVFYPFFYCVGLWPIAEAVNPHTPPLALLAFVLMFFTGWSFARGANLQKFQFKRDPHAKAFGILDQHPLTDGKRYVMTGGFWGISRHVNYFGEIIMASALALVLGYPTAIAPWLYPLYYVALLVPRQIDDDKRCAARYGELWNEYCRRVPYRIVPYIY
jgi:hypothetical protein